MSSDTFNPYVGLRPFQEDENLLFFGRDNQTVEILQRLHEHRFVAVVGGSGSGKSSLIRAGLIPALKGGYLVEDSSKWSISIMKPGQNPMYNLALAILSQTDTEVNDTTIRDLVKAMKKQGVTAILNLIMPLRKEQNVNFFLLVDQFEELFRFTMEKKENSKITEAIDFVNMLLNLTEQSKIPFYIILTMRSDFIGDCDKFHDLPEALNKSQYLVPRLTRLQLKMVIEGPAKLYGGKLNPALSSLLLNELGKVKDELPLLQHALMRMWDFEMSVDKNGELDLQDYENIGGIEKALSKHADEALKGMSAEDLQLAQEIFQALTAIDENGRKIRRPVLLSQLIELTGAKKEKIFDIIDRFIKDKRSFLVVNKAGELDNVIDISHESLIRQWTTLSEWVDEEGEAASAYLQLYEATRLHQQKKKDFLSGSELQFALDWYNDFKPSPIWANRYKEGFKDCIRYLKESENEQTRLLNIENSKKRKQRGLLVSIFLLIVVASSFSIAFLYINNQKKEVEELFLEAQAQKKVANQQTISANNEKQEAISQQKAAVYEKELAIKEKNISLYQARLATEREEYASKQANRFKELQLAAVDEKKKAIEDQKIARAFYLNSEAKNQVENDPTLALRLAENALLLNDTNLFLRDARKIRRENSFYKILAKFTSPVFSFSYSPDGNKILVGSGDSTAHLLDLNGDLLVVFRGHKGSVYTVAFSPAGDKILTGSSDSTARLWDLNGSMLQEFEFWEQAEIMSVAFSPNGNNVLTGSVEGTARLWDLNGNIIQEFYGHSGEVYSVAFSPDGNTILTGSQDKTAILWDLNGEIIQAFLGHKDWIISAVFSPTGDTILTGSADQTARLWNLEGDSLLVIKGHTYYVHSVAFSSDGSKILTGSWDQTALLWDLNGVMLQEFVGHSGEIYAVGFSSEGSSILTGSKDQTVRSWNLKENTLQYFIHPYGQIINSLAFSPDGSSILMGADDVYLWNLNGEIVQEFFGHKDYINSVAFSPKGNVILTGSADGTARLWDLNGDSLMVFKGHTKMVNSVAFSPSGDTILTGSKDSTIRLWDLNGDLLAVFRGHKGSVYTVAFSPNGSNILTGSFDKTARLWDLNGNTLKEFKGHDGYIFSVAFSPTGDTILTGSRDQTARLWNLNGETLVEFKGHTGTIYTAVFSTNGDKILSGSQDQTARLWDLNGELLQEFKGNADWITAVTFSPIDNVILTGSWDGTARLWEIAIPFEEFLNTEWGQTLSPEQKKQFGIEVKPLPDND